MYKIVIVSSAGREGGREEVFFWMVDVMKRI
jgi:hypothetical protein